MARFKFDLTRKSTWKRILSVVLATLLLAGAVFGIVKLTQFLRDKKETINPSFVIGKIDETTGVCDSNVKTSICTEEAFEAKGLEVVLDFDNNVSYQVFWYDAQNNFSHCTEELRTGKEFYTFAGYKARVEITPLNLEDDEIKWYNKHKYTSQVDIRVDKDQTIDKDDFTEVTLESDMFTCKRDYFFSMTGEWIPCTQDGTANGTPVTGTSIATYYFTNNQLCSMMYVKSLPENGDFAYGYHIRLKDGTIIEGYSSNNTVGSIYNPDKDMPTFENPLFIPEGAEFYFYGDFGDDLVYAGETVLCFY